MFWDNLIVESYGGMHVICQIIVLNWFTGDCWQGSNWNAFTHQSYKPPQFRPANFSHDSKIQILLFLWFGRQQDFFCREEVSNLENACDRPMRRNDIFRNSLKVFLYRLQGMIHDLQKIAPFLETRHTPRIFRFLKRAAIKPHKNISSICTGTCILQHFIKILQQQKT